MNQPEFAKHWSKELGSSPETLVKLKGGINNQVFRCGLNGHYWVIKAYLPNECNKHDRIKAELEFLQYANIVAPKHAPNLIAFDEIRKCLILEYIKGERYPQGKAPAENELQVAGDFFYLLNTNLDLAKEMINMQAAEGFLSLSQHIANVRSRLSSMSTDHLPCECKNKGAVLLKRLHNQTDRILNELEHCIALGSIDDTLDQMNCRVSPSDFGFHNAIRTIDGPKFIDFEFAGWDDPAKTILDFLMQPKVPVSSSLFDISKVFNNNLARNIYRRSYQASPIIELKWATIILSVLNDSRMQTLAQNLDSKKIEDLVFMRFEQSEQYISGQRSSTLRRNWNKWK